jgi:hypothetical protein
MKNNQHNDLCETSPSYISISISDLKQMFLALIVADPTSLTLSSASYLDEMSAALKNATMEMEHQGFW